MASVANAAPALRDVSLDNNTPRSGLLRGTLMRVELALGVHHKYALNSSEARDG